MFCYNKQRVRESQMKKGLHSNTKYYIGTTCKLFSSWTSPNKDKYNQTHPSM